MATKCYLNMPVGPYPVYRRFQSLADAKAHYAEYVDTCQRFGSTPESASIHYAPNRDSIHEYPDLVSEIGPRGGIKWMTT